MVTDFTETTELFVEYRLLVMVKNRWIDAHLTWLDSYDPVTDGTLTAELTWADGSTDTGEAGPSDVDGIFRPLLTASKRGMARLRLVLDYPRGVASHDLGEVTVYATSEEGTEAAPPETKIEGAIAFTKEVQWRIPFMTATLAELAETVPVTVDVQMQPQAEMVVSAPVDGIVRARRVYSSGSYVRRGQTLASISSTLGGGEDVATLDLAINEAAIARDAAAREVARMNSLVAFWPALAFGCAITAAVYVAMVWALGQFGMRL